MLDGFLAGSAVSLPIILAIAGYRLISMAQARPMLARGLVIAGVVASAMTAWEVARLRGASGAQFEELLDQVAEQHGTITAQELQIKAQARQIAVLTTQQQSDLVRRQQSEKDLQALLAAGGHPLRETSVGVEPEPAPLKRVLKTTERVASAHAPGESIAPREGLARFVVSGKRLRDRCLTDPPDSSLDREADRWFAEVLGFLRSALGAPYVSEFMNPRPAGAVPEGLAEDRVPLWRGLDQRLDALGRFAEHVHS